MKTLLIDNYDSFTFNLYQFISEINKEEPIVIYNDQMDWRDVRKLPFDNIVISPGPGRPEKESDFGICRHALQQKSIPLLGICLGHQGLGYLYGSKIVHASEVMHGRLSPIFHNQLELFEGIPQGFSAVRYHSLIVSNNIPDILEKTAWTKDGIIMGLKHRCYPLWGVQFHPESIGTEHGKCLLKNFRDISYNFIINNKSSNSRH